MATAKIPFNQSQFVNASLACNGTDNSQENNSQYQVLPNKNSPYYLTRIALNATTGQSENDTFLSM